MRSRLSGVSVVVLLVVVAIVLMLVARAWEEMAPTVPEVTMPMAGRTAAGDGEAPDPDNKMPGLTETMRRTDEHEQQTREAMDQIP